MPILNDIMDHDFLGPAFRRERGEGRMEGRIEGQMEIVLELLKRRFGAVPPRIRKRLAGLDAGELKVAGLRVLDAQAIDDIFSA